jgi:hypothetical protein
VSNVAKLKLADCHNILTRLCISTDGTRDVLRRRIKTRLEKIIATDEKDGSESDDEPEEIEIRPKTVTSDRSGKDEVKHDDEKTADVDDDEEDEPEDLDTQVSTELDFTVFQSTIYKPLLSRQGDMLTLEQFMGELKLPIEAFRVDEYWDGWKHPAKFMVVDKGMLAWLGYEGKLKDQRHNALVTLTSLFEAGSDFIYEGVVDHALLIGSDRQPKKAKILAVSYSCLLQWSMMIQTVRGAVIRRQCVAQQLLFRLYLEYQSGFQTAAQVRLLKDQGRQITQLKTRVEKLKMRRHHPELEIGFCFYIHHNQEVTTPDRYKIGKGKDVNEVLSAARKNAPYTIMDSVLYLSEEDYGIVETAMKRNFLEHRKPRSHELVNCPLVQLIEGALSLCREMNVGYKLADPSRIAAYNCFVADATSCEEGI